MKTLFSKSILSFIAVLFLSLQACNDEIKNDRDANRTQENAIKQPGNSKPSEYAPEYNTTPTLNTDAPDSGRYHGGADTSKY